MAWVDIQAIHIRTTDEGPLAPDVFWDIVTDHGVVTFQNDAVGVDAFMDRAPAHLPGFDHEAVIEAMTSTENVRFTVWERW